MDKISSYIIFNYLFPGVVYCLFNQYFFGFGIYQENVVLGVFLYYFVGLTISRVGSIFIGPIVNKVASVRFSDYSDFIDASQKDPKIEMLSEVNNMYRTIISMLLCFILTAMIVDVLKVFPTLSKYGEYAAPASLLLLFVFSYKKQTEFIRKRVTNADR